MNDDQQNDNWAKTKHTLDEARTVLADHLPPLWRGVYIGCLKEGFSEEQAMSMVKCYILKDAPAGVHIHKD